MKINVYGDGMTVEDIFKESKNMYDFADRLVMAGKALPLAEKIKDMLSDQNKQDARYNRQKYAFEEAAPIPAFRHAMEDRKKRFPKADFSHVDMTDEGIIKQLEEVGKPTKPKTTN